MSWTETSVHFEFPFSKRRLLSAFVHRVLRDQFAEGRYLCPLWNFGGSCFHVVNISFS